MSSNQAHKMNFIRFNSIDENENLSHGNEMLDHCFNKIIPFQSSLKLDLNSKSFQPKTIEETNIFNNFGEYSKSQSTEISCTEEEKSFSGMNTSALSVKSAEKQPFQVNIAWKYKTEKCKYWEISNTCKYRDNCVFAHGNSEMRQKIVNSANYKTKKCKQFYENGFCLYGPRCQFLHNDKTKKEKFSYLKALSSLGEYNNLNKLTLLRGHRLKIFEKIVSSKVDLNQDGLLKQILKIKMNYVL